jgi:hypothetical protein
MKKFAWMFAALALCAGSMVACGGDDKKANGEECTVNTDCQSDFCSIEEGQEAGKCADKTDSSDKKANGEACENNDECQSGNCAEGDNGKTCAAAESSDKKENGEACESADDCTSGYCDLMAESPVCADEPECDENADCENNEEGKLVCNIDAGKCVECLADNAVDAACDGSKPGPICVANVCSKCTDNAQCGENQECNAEGQCVGGNLECATDNECADKDGKPYCVNSVCVAEKPDEVDPCADVRCDAGTCELGICVTDDMKAITEDAACDPATFQSFCLGNGSVTCYENKVVIDDCTEEDAGSCTVVDVLYGKLASTCAGNADMLARCDAADPNAATVDMCYGSFNAIASVFCVKDVFGKTATYFDKFGDKCGEANPCQYVDNAPVCKAAE